MNMQLTLSFSKIFGKNIIDPEELLQTLDYEYTLASLALVNSMVGAGHDFQSIFSFWSQNWPEEVKNAVIASLKRYLSGDKGSLEGVFNRPVLVDLIAYEASKLRRIDDFQATNKSSHHLFLAYVYFNEKFGDRITADSHKEITVELDFFQKKTWPMLLRQYIYSYNVNTRLEFHKGVVFFNTVCQDEELSKNLTSFLEYHKSPSHSHYLLEMGNIINASKNKVKDGFPSFNLNVTPALEGYLDNFCISTSDNKEDFKHLLVTPLIKHSNGSYIVLDWLFLANKLYQGVVFDFYNYGKVSANSQINKYNSFKSFIGKEIIERKVFAPIVSKIFHKKHIKVEFDFDEKIQGSADAVVLDGKKLFLFELKDIALKSSLFLNCEINNFINEIDNSFVKKKGAAQLYRWLEKFDPETENVYGINNIRSSQVTVFPILVVTDYIMTMPGIDHYVKNHFDHKELSKKYKHCHPPVVIPLSFLFNHIGEVRKKGLANIIKWYNKLVKEIHRKEKGVNIEKFMSSYQDIFKMYKEHNEDDAKTNLEVQQELLSEIDYVFENNENAES